MLRRSPRIKLLGLPSRGEGCPNCASGYWEFIRWPEWCRIRIFMSFSKQQWTVSFCRKGQRLSKLAEAEKLIWTSLRQAPSLEENARSVCQGGSDVATFQTLKPCPPQLTVPWEPPPLLDRKSTRLNSSHANI